ncbi:MAG: hypothetical protein ACXACC_03220 [Promethearchaeota archaeon]|jgi:hypothetical protein
MTKDNSEKPYLLLREIFNEILLRNIIIFTILFLFTLAQTWDTIILFLFPIISFAYSLIFRIISTNKWRINSETNPIIYNPIGVEKRHANRLEFCALFQLILLFWIGAESLYHPQLIDDYTIYFNTLYFFVYSFGFYWIMIDIWKYSRFGIILKKTDPEYEKSKPDGEINKVISFLKFEKFKRISILNLIVFLAANVLNTLFALAIQYNIISGIPFLLPGTGIESSEPLQITLISLFMIVISPLLTSLFLLLIYKDINNFSLENLNVAIVDLPDNLKKQILENIKNLNNRFSKILSIE